LGGKVILDPADTTLHEARVRALFRDSFGHEAPLGWFDWKYQVQRGVSRQLLDSHGQLIAHYAGFPRRMIGLAQHLVEGSPEALDTVSEFEVLQIGDVMVAPRHRGVFGRRGSFAALARDFIDEHVGSQEPIANRSYRWIYGFPNDRHLKIGEYLGLYAPVASMHELVWPISPLQYRMSHEANPIRLVADRLLQDQTSFDAWSRKAVEALVKTRGVCTGRRNALWWDQRFGGHDHYHLFGYAKKDSLIEKVDAWGSSLKGIFALRFHQRGAQRSAELLDMMADLDTWSETLRCAMHCAADGGAHEMRCWISRPAASFFETISELANVQTNIETLPFLLASGIWSAPSLHDQLWVMGGDTDFR
jgi:hypothetical protein